MRKLTISAVIVATTVLLSSCASRNQAHAQTMPSGGDYGSYAAPLPAGGAAGDEATIFTWPMRFSDGSTDFTVFEPQYDSWDGHDLSGRCAVAVQGLHQVEASYGVFSFNAITLVDKTSRTVTLANFRVTSADFPSERDQAESYIASITQYFPKQNPVLSLDKLESSLAVAAPPKHDELNNLPPKILVATRPAVLVYIDGPPAWRAVPDTDLQRVINTQMLLLKDSGGHYYLHLFDGYVEATSLNGPWTVANQVPAGAAIAEKAAVDSGHVDLMAGSPDSDTQKLPSLKTSPVPDVLVATTPSELIAFKGPPSYSSIPGTDLLYADNTTGNVFKSLKDQQNYILVSGRWYQAASLGGPWEFVPGNKLPSDFANIPDDSPKENVKASVPGTQQAEEALIANSIPQSAAVSRTNLLAAPQIDGSMQLAPIKGTPLHYIVNSATPIVELDPQSWYACQDGVWYTSSSATGPWSVATFVPPVIYTIPPDSPLHYLTYVQVYGASPDVVYEGYTPGYLGTEVAADGTVVYGTGYYYEPWIGSVWYGPPLTWGWGFDDCWTPWWGWGFGCGFGWGWGWGGYYPPHPWWGGYAHWHDHRDGWYGGHHDHGGWANTGSDIYRHNHGPATVGQWHGPRSNQSRYGGAYNSRTGRLQAGQAAQVRSVPGAAWDRNRSAYHFDRGNSTGWHGRNPEVWNSTHIAPKFGDMNRGFQTYPRGSWSSGHNWNGPAHVWTARPGGSFQGGVPHATSGGSWGGGGSGFHASHGGGWHGGGGGDGGWHGAGGGGGGWHGGGGGGGHGGGGRR